MSVLGGKVLSIGALQRPAPDGWACCGRCGNLRHARDEGLFHPNCRQRSMICVPGRSKPLHNTSDPEGDKPRQQQRAKERRVRGLKSQIAALEPLSDTAELKTAEAKLRAHSADFKQWREDNGRKNEVYRTSLVNR